MASGLLFILTIFLCYSAVTTAITYHYNETSEAIPYNPYTLSGFRDVINKDFVIGGLFPVYDCTLSVDGDLEMLEAMLFALDLINNDMSLLPNLTIGYDVRDTCNDSLIGIDEVSSMIRLVQGNYPLLGIVGPASTSITLSVAAALEHIQVPLIGYGSSSATLSDRHLFEYFYEQFHQPTFKRMQWLIWSHTLDGNM